MDDGTWEGEEPPEGLPPAPVPVHERQWRHPSELGRIDPAVESRSLGRGVLALAGATGVALSLVLGRALIPDRDRQNDPQAVTSAAITPVGVVATTGPAPIAPPTTTAATPGTSTSADLPTTEAVATPTAAPPSTRAVANTDPSEETAASVVGNPATDIVAIDGADDRLVGLVWGDGRHSITAAAVGGPGTLCVVTLPDGRRLEAVVVGSESGLAVLELSAAATPARLAAAWPPFGDLHFTASDGTAVSAPFPAAPEATIGLPDGRAIVAGTALLDDAGHLVGLGVPDGEGRARLVPLTPADGMIERATALGAWLGVKSGPDGASSIAELAPDAPAGAAGLQVGDTITAIDGDVVESLRELGARLRVLAPGVVVVLTVERDGAVFTVSVTTTSRPGQVGEPGSD